ncbi:hypothetical protein [Mangrovibacillus cuniculi]|uniref:Uncharacterized protein n=1 Tax=Mangrovibacillus cuniculi TaxID=2593652 RepID=A0A7S8CA01_9BACI|nr:hypothetical protein [Mangrovibacillus cuniculi]QPC46156.1 hypothetical protein G8O30_03870 [Mangrovibacillus cuniculi]
MSNHDKVKETASSILALLVNEQPIVWTERELKQTAEWLARALLELTNGGQSSLESDDVLTGVMMKLKITENILRYKIAKREQPNQ